MKPTIFIELSSDYRAVAAALKQVATAFGAEPVPQLFDGEIEADIAVTNTIEAALRMVKESEQTRIGLAYFYRRDQGEAKAFAARFPDRITAAPMIAFTADDTEIVPFLVTIIASKRKE